MALERWPKRCQNDGASLPLHEAFPAYQILIARLKTISRFPVSSRIAFSLLYGRDRIHRTVVGS